MAVRFILGRAGSGKTRYCTEQIGRLLRQRPLGPAIYWLLPRQATFQAERELTCGLGGFSRVRVVSFDALGREILSSCGDVGIPEVTPIGRRMVVGHLLRRHQGELRFYSASARRPGLAAELDSTFGEFERAGFDATALDDLLHRLEPEHATAALADKLHDVRLLLNAYNQYIGQDRLDPQRRLQLVLKRVAGCSLLKDAIVFVDDFFDFTEYERKLLTAVAAASERTEIAMLLDPTSEAAKNPRALLDEMSLFHRTERAYQSLRKAIGETGATIEPPLLLKEGGKRFKSEELIAVEEKFLAADGKAFSAGAGPGTVNSKGKPGAGGKSDARAVELIDAPDARTEVDAVARKIREAIRDGLRLRDIAVLVRDAGDYQELIDASFREHDLNYFLDRRRTASHHPLLQFVRSALLIVRNGWPHDAMMTLLKSGLGGVSEDEADELENYVLRHRIRGTMWASETPWAFRAELIGSEDESLAAGLTATGHINELRQRVVSKLARFAAAVKPSQRAKAIGVREIITQLFLLLEAFGVRQTLSKWMNDAERAGRLEQRGEHEQVWAELMKLFEHMAELLGDEAMTVADFLEVLDGGLESFDLALTPPTVDQILVGQIDRTRTPEVKLVFVLGLNEGQFPKVHHEDCVLSDSERRVLRKRNVDLDPETERRLLDERLLAYVAFTRASHRLVVTRPLADQRGRPRNPSPFWSELPRVTPAAVIEHVPRLSQGDSDGIGTPRQLVTALMRWVRRGGDAGQDAGPWAALYQWLATYTCCNDAIDVMRFRAWKALGYVNEAKLSSESAAKLFPSPLQSTVARLEAMAACPFQHFVRYGLRLVEREEPDVTSLDLHHAYHRVLQNVIADIIKNKTDWCEQDPAKTAELIGVHTAEIGRTLRGELMLSTARNRYLLERIGKTLADAVAAQIEMHRRGKYRPAFAGLKFGDGGALPPHRVATPGGNEVHLHGKIDRVDLHERGGAFVVADYKLAAGPLAMDRVYYGLSLQLLTYILVLQAGGAQLAGRKLTPAAAFFVQMLRSPQSVDHPEEGLAPDHPDFHLRLKPRGIIDSRAVQSLDSGCGEGYSKVVQVYIKKDGQLGNRHSTDVADEAEFTALLKHVENQLGVLGDRLVSGEIGITPFYINRDTPCPRCAYRSVCRFEPGINRYNVLPGIKRDEVLKQLADGGGHEH